jgi:hypothetical protein
VYYSINIGVFAGGTVASDKSIAAAGETVTLYITPATGYTLYNIQVDANVTLYGTGNTRTFTMPARDVAVSATFQSTSVLTAWNAAHAFIENTTFTLTQVEAANESAARHRLAVLINALIAPTGFSITADDIVIFVFLPATAGDGLTPTGVNGHFEFRVSPTNVPNSAYNTGVITATAFDPTANETLRSDTKLTAWAQNGILHINGLTVGELWSIYNLSGVLIYRNLATDHEATIRLPDRGIYIIKSGNQTMKIVQ